MSAMADVLADLVEPFHQGAVDGGQSVPESAGPGGESPAQPDRYGIYHKRGRIYSLIWPKTNAD